MSQFQDIAIPLIHLEWSAWTDWNELLINATSGGVPIPQRPGVYEARIKGQEERLTIGKASKLNNRVRRGLVQGKMRHSAGKDIRAEEDVSNVEVRWAETDRPCAVEEELHRMYIAYHGKWPKYTDHT